MDARPAGGVLAGPARSRSATGCGHPQCMMAGVPSLSLGGGEATRLAIHRAFLPSLRTGFPHALLSCIIGIDRLDGLLPPSPRPSRCGNAGARGVGLVQHFDARGARHRRHPAELAP
ncbi:hypothetical protein XAC3810_730101 [Xanthomonas citri pv. citri]|nr:hypothetical protein XAC9322_700100 [Xanthomonas citri pv. citri]CEJ47634.1 hypothetical protein XAB3213_3960024 [Xanthomonas citri pv. bilvae]CEE38855.1 hypothetical protein XAC1083_720101 [Xanthomonas citri pv. citri]CEE46764.1 hypothetical protein XAC3810_730101 [Xanthomonas citri pv. citri]CEE75523.1 hypothetical protein XACW160_710077 [Xanthomonas citri pv. citri]